MLKKIILMLLFVNIFSFAMASVDIFMDGIFELGDNKSFKLFAGIEASKLTNKTTFYTYNVAYFRFDKESKIIDITLDFGLEHAIVKFFKIVFDNNIVHTDSKNLDYRITSGIGIKIPLLLLEKFEYTFITIPVFNLERYDKSPVGTIGARMIIGNTAKYMHKNITILYGIYFKPLLSKQFRNRILVDATINLKINFGKFFYQDIRYIFNYNNNVLVTKNKLNHILAFGGGIKF